MEPSQSLSRLSQVSATGPCTTPHSVGRPPLRQHCTEPPMHLVTPSWQVPTLEPQAMPTDGSSTPSSAVEPSRSSSRPLHISGPGVGQPSPSSIRPSQSSSIPLQTSATGAMMAASHSTEA